MNRIDIDPTELERPLLALDAGALSARAACGCIMARCGVWGGGVALYPCTGHNPADESGRRKPLAETDGRAAHIAERLHTFDHESTEAEGFDTGEALEFMEWILRVLETPYYPDNKRLEVP